MKYAIILSMLLLAGCQKNPESTTHVGNDFKVQKLFEVDGCTVYRFHDDRTVYFTKCDGVRSNTSYTESCGKGCTRTITN